MSILSHDSIVDRCVGVPTPLVEPFEKAQVKTAAYDLRVGREYYIDDPPLRAAGPIGGDELDDNHRTLHIRANQVVLVQTLEKLAMPTNLVGHLSLKVDVLLQGLIMSSQSQVDAGYKGPIFVLLYNLSDQPVNLQYEQSFLRLEFAKLDKPTEPYEGGFKAHYRLPHVVKRRLTSSLVAVSREARDARRDVRRLGIGGAVALGVAVFGIIVQLLGPIQTDASDAKSASTASRRDVATLQQQIRTLQTELARLQTTTTTTPGAHP